MNCEHTTFLSTFYFLLFLRERERGSEASKIKKEGFSDFIKGVLFLSVDFRDKLYESVI